ncbi:MAG: ShlB/FhaC/HecB family hemolysin secretion/activation protein [Verrucomicrobiales bacterium]
MMKTESNRRMVRMVLSGVILVGLCGGGRSLLGQDLDLPPIPNLEQQPKANALQRLLQRTPEPKKREPIQLKDSGRKAYYTPNEVRYAPETPTGGRLRAYGTTSRYSVNGATVYSGETQESAGLRWLKQGASPNSSDPAAGSKFDWRNPFQANSDSGVAVSDIQNIGDVSGDIQASGVDQSMASEEPILSYLSGIVLIPRAIDIKRRTGVQGIVNEGVILPPKVEKALQPHLGQPMSMASLNRLVRAAIVAYRSSDMPVVDVLVPEQEVSTGVLQLVVIEGRLGEVLVEGAKRSSEAQLRKSIRLGQGDILKESVLTQDLAYLNKNPFRRVDLIYSPGADYGVTDLILRTEELNPIMFYTAYENSGTEVLGEDRFLAGVNWAGPFFFPDDTTLSYQYTLGLNNPDIEGHTGVLTSLLPWRHQLTVLGAYVYSKALIDVDGEELVTGGANQQYSARYAIPLRTFSSLSQELELGFDYKSSGSNLAFGGTEVFDTTTEIYQFSAGYNVTQRDKLGTTKLDTEFVWSPGGFGAGNSEEAFASQRAGAGPDYMYGRAALERNNALIGQWTLVGRVEGQASNSNLLSSEQLGAGGFDSVRGFEQRAVRGDQGVVVSVEVRAPAVSPAKLLGFYRARDAMVPLVFFDYGHLSNSEKLPGEPDINISSTGFGFRYQLDDNFSLRFDYGWQLGESGFEDGEDSRFHIGARAVY